MGKWKAHLAVFGANLIYGANYTIAKGVMPDHIQPRALVAIRVFCAMVLFWIMKTFLVKEKIRKGDWPRIIACGVFGVAVNQTLFLEGLNLTSEVNASIIMTSNPIIVMVIAAIVIKEAVTARKVVGIAIGAVGAIVLLMNNQGSGLTGGGLVGDIMVLINSTSYAIYLVIVKPLMKKYNFITIISWAFFFGMLIVAPLGFNGFSEIEWSKMSAGIIGSTIYVVVATTFLAYLLNIYGLKHLNASNVSSYIYLQPVLAVLFALAIAFDEKIGDLNMIKVGCAALIFFGVYLVSSGKKQEVRPN